MPKSSNYLKAYRRRAHLTQEELSFLLGIKDKSSLSRIESGDRKPSIEMLLLCKHIFGEELTRIYLPITDETKEVAKERIWSLLKHLRPTEKDPPVKRKIEFLEATFNRLSSS